MFFRLLLYLEQQLGIFAAHFFLEGFLYLRTEQQYNTLSQTFVGSLYLSALWIRLATDVKVGKSALRPRSKSLINTMCPLSFEKRSLAMRSEILRTITATVLRSDQALVLFEIPSCI